MASLWQGPSAPPPGLKAVLAQEPRFAVAVFTHADDLRLLLQALRMGVRGYLLKSADTEELVDALKRLAAGETVIAPRLATEAALLAAREIDIDRWPGVHLGLTQREAELLMLLGQGFSPQHAADEMQISSERPSASTPATSTGNSV